MTYYSKRGKKLSFEVSEEFWNAFKACITDFANGVWFPAFREWESSCNGVYWFVNHEKVNLEMLQELGKALYPFNNISIQPDDETIFDLIEFFFKYVCKPLDIETYDKRQGRYEYTIRINYLFDNFSLGYQLKKGEVKARHAEVLDKFVSKIDFDIPDKETESLIKTAIEKFYSRNFKEQKIGLEKLVDACQRITTWEGNNKKKSIEKILKEASKEQEEMEEILDEDWKVLWDIANKFMIRHTEKGKIPINDIDSLEYLFYAYFNVIRFILKKYGYIIEKEQDIEETVEEIEEGEELPF